MFEIVAFLWLARVGDEEANGLGLALVFGDAGLFAGSGWNWTFVLIKKISALAIG